MCSYKLGCLDFRPLHSWACVCCKQVNFSETAVVVTSTMHASSWRLEVCFSNNSNEQSHWGAIPGSSCMACVSSQSFAGFLGTPDLLLLPREHLSFHEDEGWLSHPLPAGQASSHMASVKTRVIKSFGFQFPAPFLPFGFSNPRSAVVLPSLTL